MNTQPFKQSIILYQRILTCNRALLAILIAVLGMSSFAVADNIYQTGSMPGGKYWGDTGYWSGAIPSTSTANNYYVGQGASGSIVFRTKDQGTTGSSDTFPSGNTLWMGYNTNGTFSAAQAQIGLKSWNFTVNDLQLGNALINQAMSDGTANLKGSMAVNGTVIFQFSNAVGRKINVQSAISGDGTIELAAQSSYDDNLTISSANNAFTGVLNVRPNSSVVLSGANAMKSASSIVIGNGATLKLNAAQTFVENSISGSGKLQIRADQNSVADQTALYGVSNDFTGTINVTNNARAEYSKPLSENVKLVIDNGAQFRVGGKSDPVINCDIELTGQGKPIGDKNSGGLVFHECSGTSVVNGKININSNNSMIGSYYIAKTVFAGEIDTKGNTFEFRQTRGGGSGNNSSFTIIGDVSSTGNTLGTVHLAYDVNANVADTHLYFGDSTAADENAPTNQTINANVSNANKNEIVFQPGANRTITVNGALKYNSNNNTNNKGFIKNGEGTLVLTADSSALTAPTTINAGVVQLTGDAVNVMGPVTVNANGTLEFNVEEGEKTLTFANNNKIVGTGKITKTGEGVLKLYADAQNKVVSDSFVVSAGELDFKGYFEGNLEVINGAVFSPGNSIGELSVTGNVDITNGTALFEFDSNDDNKFDVLNILGDGNTFTAGAGMIELYFADDPQTWAVDGAEYKIVSDDGFTAGSYNSWLSNYTDLFGLTGKSDGLYLVTLASPQPGSGVPEPSTWALMALGVIALFLRKRVRN